eukprot:363597-Chlamydomonas_euryale.AAC.5
MTLQGWPDFYVVASEPPMTYPSYATPRAIRKGSKHSHTKVRSSQHKGEGEPTCPQGHTKVRASLAHRLMGPALRPSVDQTAGSWTRHCAPGHIPQRLASPGSMRLVSSAHDWSTPRLPYA